jgi:hypothetical protein
MANYFVSLQGNDSNTGSINSPFATVNAAIERVKHCFNIIFGPAEPLV